MGALTSALAFPHPPRDWSVDALQSHHGLTFLKTQSGLRIPALHVEQKGSKFTIIFSHGNGEDVGLSIFFIERLAQVTGASVLAYEYPGYSISEGSPSEKNCYEAIDAALEYLTHRPPQTPESGTGSWITSFFRRKEPTDSQSSASSGPLGKVVLFGRSLGTGVTVDLAARTPGLAGVVLMSPLESGARCLFSSAFSRAVYLLDIFRSYEKVRHVDCPVFIMHGSIRPFAGPWFLAAPMTRCVAGCLVVPAGEIDEVVPCSSGRALYNTLEQRRDAVNLHYEPHWYPNAGHNNMPTEDIFERTAEFLSFLEKRTETGH